jgi:hypothetical protein
MSDCSDAETFNYLNSLISVKGFINLPSDMHCGFDDSDRALSWPSLLAACFRHGHPMKELIIFTAPSSAFPFFCISFYIEQKFKRPIELNLFPNPYFSCTMTSLFFSFCIGVCDRLFLSRGSRGQQGWRRAHIKSL